MYGNVFLEKALLNIRISRLSIISINEFKKEHGFFAWLVDLTQKRNYQDYF